MLDRLNDKAAHALVAQKRWEYVNKQSWKDAGRPVGNAVKDLADILEVPDDT